MLENLIKRGVGAMTYFLNRIGRTDLFQFVKDIITVPYLSKWPPSFFGVKCQYSRLVSRQVVLCQA